MATYGNNADSSKTKGVTVAVIGAGLAGIAAVKSSLDEGLNPTCFEQDNQIGTLLLKVITKYTDQFSFFVRHQYGRFL